MIKYFFAFLLIISCLLPSAAFGQTAVKITAQERKIAEGVTADQLKDYLYFVASDEMEGRDTPSRGLDTTAKFIAMNLSRWGFKPAGDDGTFFQKIGGFDHLVFTAGDTLQLDELAATDLTKARRAFELRYWAVLAAVKYASPQIRKDGSIVLTTGVAGRRPHKGWTVAASVCGTIEALTRALAVELAPIRVNAVCPGVVRTNLWQSMNADAREHLYESVGKSLLVGRVGEACEIEPFDFHFVLRSRASADLGFNGTYFG